MQIGCRREAGLPRVEAVNSGALLTAQRGRGFLREFDYSINPYSGCVFQCGGCYVPDLLYGRAERLGGWGSYVEARVRAVELLQRQRSKLEGAVWFMSPVSDVYQPAERRFRLTRALLEALREMPFEWGLLSTRSPLILEDLELLRSFGSRVEVGISVPTDREELRRQLDPKNPPVGHRLETARRLREAGVPVRLHVAPVQPHTERFPALASEVADWVWMDRPEHLRLVRPAYEKVGIPEAMERGWVEAQVERWRAELGPERVGYGQEAFCWRASSPRNCTGEFTL